MILRKLALFVLALTLLTSCANNITTTLILTPPRYDIATTSATVSWTTVIDDTFEQYRLYRSSTPGVDDTATLLATITEQGTVTYGENFGSKPTAYYYYVVYKDNSDGTTKSNEVILNGLNIFDFSFGTCGTGDGQFSYASDVAVDSDGTIYVADAGNNLIQTFDSAGNFLSEWGTSGAGDNQFQDPYSIELCPNENLYIGDANNNRVQIFSRSGTFIDNFSSIGQAGDSWIAADGTIYVPDATNHMIRVFNSSFIQTSTFGTPGSGNGNLAKPWDVTMSLDETKIYVLDQDNTRVQIFSSSGVYSSQFATNGTDPGECAICWGMAVDNSGYVYVTDWGEGKVQIYEADGTFIEEFTIPAGNNAYGIWGLGFDSDNKMYVTDVGNCVVHVYGP